MHTVDAKEIGIFAKDSAHWWDIKGPFAPLHRLNPVRLSYLKDCICDHYDRDAKDIKALQGLSILDIGCGGGLICEPMSRMGGTVTGIDADQNAIEVARTHADQSGLHIAYMGLPTDDLIKTGQQFDVVLALEIVEHVADVDKFVGHCVDLCKPGGIILFSTLNRTPKSFLLGKIAAEYILRWVPHGTHDWKKFLKPSELSRAIRAHGANVQDISGMIFNPVKGEFTLSENDVSVNYFISATKD